LSAVSAWSFAFFAAIISANAQFKVVGPAPYSPAVARQQIGALLDGVNPSNQQQTIEKLAGLLSWYRDILDEELIAAWQKNSRANLPEVMEALADSRVASAVVEFSWREQRQAAFHLVYAPMFGNLMARFPESAKPFLDDLLETPPSSPQIPNLQQPQAETVCRILLDMPDVGTWRKNALAILPHYRRAAEGLLIQDLHGMDREKSYQAQLWLNDLKTDAPATGERQSPRRQAIRSQPSAAEVPPSVNQPPSMAQVPATGAQARATGDQTPVPAAIAAAPPYNGARSGTLECGFNPIPQNAEYVFRNLPPVNLRLDYDTKIWDARLEPGQGRTQRVILKNKSSGPQKRCVVHWSVIP
jgi:hypothetical protein